ncbi:hypothetical protein RHMOL_Rhmol11G0021300 [Rhododendron molle]|uniref:Uncharacterized protein n=1 Tax=Rhododendron molle TaxID=49168 RepID=A0ACC0LN57_RHOML|nr:hypothetical protein RHMOL_Rhmol11G0021300 [Rhododendron molle]
MVLEAAAQAQGTHVTTSQHQEVPFSNPNPKTLYNARGIPHLEGDPNLGYSEEDTKPMRPLASERYSVPSISPQAIPHQGSNNPRLITNVHKPKPKNWASLLQSQSPSMELKLDFYPELFRGREAQVEIDIELTDVGRWDRYLVGHFLDGKMPYALVVPTARYQWKELFVGVKPDVARCYLFEFRSKEAKQQVLDGGPYFFSQKYLILKDWHRMIKPVKEQPSHIPAWVRLHNLPLELWNQECLSRVASTIGKPLHVDQATTKTSKQPGLLQTKSTSAKVCIEISAEHDLPEDVRTTVGGNSVVVPIEYQVLPLMCKHCQAFGHSTIQCSKKPPSSSNQPNQDWTLVGGGNRGLILLKDELRKALVGIVSSSQEPLIQTQTDVPADQFPVIISSSNIPSTNIPSSGTTFEHNYNEMHCPDQLSQQKPPSGSFKEGQGSDKELNSFTQQMNSEAPLSRSAAKKAAKIAAKLRDKEPPDLDQI